MEIKNINSNSNKNLQLISTFGEKNQHKYIDLLEFKYSVDGEVYSVRDLFEKIFELEKKNEKLKNGVKTVLENTNKVQTLLTTSLDLMDVRTQTIQQELNELETKIKNIIK